MSEEIIGRWLKGRRRDDLVIATKVFGTMGEAPNAGGLSRKHIVRAVEDSLRRLGTDHIDLYQTHVWDATTPVEETLATLDTLVKAGKVRYLGASNLSASQLQRSQDLARRNGWEPYVSLQPLYNLLAREVEWELAPVSLAEGVGIIPWSPLQGGWLTGKYRRGMTAVEPGTREARYQQELGREAWRERDDERTWRVVETVVAVAEEAGRTPSAGRPALAARTPRRDGTDRGGAHGGAADRQPRRGGLGADAGADGPAGHGERAPAALSVRRAAPVPGPRAAGLRAGAGSRARGQAPTPRRPVRARSCSAACPRSR